MLREKKRLDIATVVKKLNISEATARRLFSSLETDGKLIRIHGGIQLAPELESAYSFKVSAAMNKEEKTQIGFFAAQSVKSGERIFLDSGTTVMKMAEALAKRIRSGELENLLVVTNSISCINNLAEVCKITLIGGTMRPERLDVCGPVAENNLTKYHFDKTYIGADAISLQGEIMATDEATCHINEIAIAQSQKNIVLAAANKFAKSSFISFGNLDSKYVVYTDSSLPAKKLSMLKKTKAEIILV